MRAISLFLMALCAGVTAMARAPKPPFIRMSIPAAIGMPSAPANVEAFGLFPNPATDSRFVVSLDLRWPARSVLISATDALGLPVYSKEYGYTGKRFFEEVVLEGACKGLYFVQVTIDGEPMLRRVVLE